jgi:tRNA(Ile2) C34 agmatinyltransferase TiaS
MILVGIDDTDTLDSPGTNQLARHLVLTLRGELPAEWIVRHQLLFDERVPYTRKNGCVTIAFQPPAGLALGDLAARLVPLIRAWCPLGSDPGLCITDRVPPAVVEFGRHCQRQFVRQQEARDLARKHGIYLEGLGGTDDGVIGALAAVGLASLRQEGRIIFLGTAQPDIHEVCAWQSVAALHALGIDEIRQIADGAAVTAGEVEIVKRLRPNFHHGQVVLFVRPAEPPGSADQPRWLAERVV